MIFHSYVNVYQRIIIPHEIVDLISTHAALHGLRSACERQAISTQKLKTFFFALTAKIFILHVQKSICSALVVAPWVPRKSISGL